MNQPPSAAEIARFLEKTGIAVQNLAQNLQLALEAIHTKLVPVVEGIVKLNNISEAFKECELWLSPSMVELADKIVQLYNEGKKQIIPSIVSRHFQKNNYAALKKAVSQWENNSFFQPRMRILYDALEAHINGKYTLSVPTLLPHIEGIAKEIIEKYSPPESKKSLIYREGADGENAAKTWLGVLSSKVGLRKIDIEEFIATQTLLYYLEGTMYLSPRKSGKELKDFATKDILNRHSILHGAHIKYDTSMNSLRCFLALDALSLIDEKEYELDR